MADMSRATPISANSIALTAVHPVGTQGISLPKIGTLIPNRIFVGGISTTTTEDELRAFFSVFGAIKDVKVIYDKSGLSKGSYGFVTFEDQQTAESIIKNEAESLIFKDRKLNIGYAVRKQPIFQKHELGSTLLVAHNGLSLVQLCPHDHSVIAMNHQPTFCYPATVMVPSGLPNHQLCALATGTSNIPTSILNSPPGSSHLSSPPTNHQTSNQLLFTHTLPASPLNTNTSFFSNAPRSAQPWKHEIPMLESRDKNGSKPTTLFTPASCVAPSNVSASNRSNYPTYLKQSSSPLNSCGGSDPFHCLWYAGNPRLPNTCPTVIRQPVGQSPMFELYPTTDRNHISHMTQGDQREPVTPSSSSSSSTSSLTPSGSTAQYSASVQTVSATDQSRQFPFLIGTDLCRCKVEPVEPVDCSVATGKQENWDNTNLQRSVQFTNTRNVMLADTPCGAQCLYHSPRCPASSFTLPGTGSDLDKSFDPLSPPHHLPPAYTSTQTSSTDCNPNTLIRRILQSHPCDPRFTSQSSSSSSSSSSSQTAFGQATGLNSDVERMLQHHDRTLDESGTGLQQSVINLSRSCIPSASAASEAMGSPSRSSNSCCLPRSTTPTPQCAFGGVRSCQLDKPATDENQMKNFTIGRDFSSFNTKQYYGQTSQHDKATDPVAADFWLETLRSSDPFAPRRLFGIDLLQNDTGSDTMERSDLKVTIPLLTSGNSSATSACGDISKQRPE